jgi:hypothetical protein
LRSRQSRWAPRRWPRGQSPCPLSPVRRRPAKYGTHRRTHCARHCRQARVRVEQPDRLSAPPFQLSCGPLRSHTSEYRPSRFYFPLLMQKSITARFATSRYPQGDIVTKATVPAVCHRREGRADRGGGREDGRESS